VPDAHDGGASQDDLEHDAGHPHDERHDHDREVLEEHGERQQHDAERRERVEAGERRGEEGAEGAGDDEHTEDDVGQAVVEQEAQAGPGDPLEPADQPHEAGDEALLTIAGQLEGAPAFREPDVVAPEKRGGGVDIR
jgi:hypothetical protein